MTYAVGDVHGHLDLLRALVDGIEAHADGLGRPARVVFLGDYVDRGPDSRGVVDFVMAGPRRPGDVWIPLKGNHDHMLVECVLHGGDHEWLEHFAGATLRSYGMPPYRGGRVPEPTAEMRRHLDWISKLPLFLDDGEHLYVHAGLVPGKSLDDMLGDDPDLLMWMREGFTDNDAEHDQVIVHGHTIVGPLPRVGPYRISVDTGVHKNGALTCAVVDVGGVTFLQARRGPGDVIEVGPVEPTGPGAMPRP